MRVIVVQRFDRRFLDVLRCVEIRFADLHVHDAAAFGFELPCAGEHFKSILGPQPSDGGGDSVFVDSKHRGCSFRQKYD